MCFPRHEELNGTHPISAFFFSSFFFIAEQSIIHSYLHLTLFCAHTVPSLSPIFRYDFTMLCNLKCFLLEKEQKCATTRIRSRLQDSLSPEGNLLSDSVVSLSKHCTVVECNQGGRGL